MTRYEVVARWTVGGRTWIVPASEGKHYRKGWPKARWTAWRWTRRSSQDANVLPPFHWIVRRG